MKIAIPKETARGEKRVAIVPETVKKLAAKGITSRVERGAGLASSFSDDDYRQAGAEVAESFEALLAGADALVKVTRPTDAELGKLPEGMTLVSLQYPLASPDFVKQLVARKLTSIALDMIPRTTLAQSMDVLSSQ